MATTEQHVEIRADGLYRLNDIKTRLGLGAAAIREARRNGLVVYRVGRVSVIRGRDLLEYVERCGRKIP